MMTLKQARRMVAKSRRRVWRLARLYGYSTWVAADVNRTGVALNLAESVNYYSWGKSPRGPAFHRAAEELRTRWDRLRQMETIIGERKWALARARAIELPALDHGQDGDELLQDIADYYADPDAQAGLDDDLYSEPCPVCGDSMDWEDCPHCVDGYNGHDCGEDVCCCLYPEDNEVCDICDGRGGWYHCWRKHD